MKEWDFNYGRKRKIDLLIYFYKSETDYFPPLEKNLSFTFWVSEVTLKFNQEQWK